LLRRQVLLVKNLDQKAGLVNGVRGKVLCFEGDGEDTFPRVQFLLNNDTYIEKASLTSKPPALLDPLSHLHTRSLSPLQVISREEFTLELDGSKATRQQVPLKLAWALTIHKSQGMTINLLEADVSNCFDEGQAYVALSRATALKRLKVIGFSPSCVKVSDRVLKWHEKLRKGKKEPASVFSEATNKPAQTFDAETFDTADASVWQRCLKNDFQPASSAAPAPKRVKVEVPGHQKGSTPKPPTTPSTASTSMSSEARARMEAKRAEAMRRLQAKKQKLAAVTPV